MCKFKFKRWIGRNENDEIELIGFSDASFEAYAAFIYSRVRTTAGHVTRLIAAKGRVAPIRNRTYENENERATIPKLELAALELLAELFGRVAKMFNGHKLSFRAYTDSEILPAWTRKPTEIENKFVKRRVANIRKILNPADFHWISTHQNQPI